MAPWSSKGWQAKCSATRNTPTRRRCWLRFPAAISPANAMRQNPLGCDGLRAARSQDMLRPSQQFEIIAFEQFLRVATTEEHQHPKLNLAQQSVGHVRHLLRKRNRQ